MTTPADDTVDLPEPTDPPDASPEQPREHGAAGHTTPKDMHTEGQTPTPTTTPLPRR